MYVPALQISEHFRELSQRLYERPNCIEDLTEQREFVKTVPDLVQSNQSHIDQVFMLLCGNLTQYNLELYPVCGWNLYSILP